VGRIVARVWQCLGPHSAASPSNWQSRLLRLLLAILICLPASAPVQAEPKPVERVDVRSRRIENFRIGRDITRFGPLEFVGGLEMTAPSGHFGGFSALRFLTPGAEFMGITDTGYWYFGTIERDAEMRPVGVKDFRMVPMVDRDGRPYPDKSKADAESLDVKGDIATVGFEREHRIEQFRIDPDNMSGPIRRLGFLIPSRELRQNRGFETITRAHPHGQHQGGLVAVTEKSLDKDGNIFAAIIEGPQKGIFTIRRVGEFDITDGAFLPNGDLLLLERSYRPSEGVRMRLRRISGELIAKGVLADGPVLLEADMSYQIDNMEGLDVWQRKDGATMVSIISDDNHSILQRNLYLEFILHDE
jgi:Uncharacterized protein conserved in bacteria